MAAGGPAGRAVETMLPLSLLRTAIGHPMLIELKNGDTYNGRLVSCDTWMNINLGDVICTSRVGARARAARGRGRAAGLGWCRRAHLRRPAAAC